MALRVARELREAGISTQKLRAVVQRLRKEGWCNPLAQCKLVMVGSQVHIVRGYRKLESLLDQPGQGVFAFMLDLDRTVQEIKRQVKALRAA